MKIFIFIKIIITQLYFIHNIMDGNKLMTTY